MKKALFIFLSAALGNILAANAQYYNTTGKHLYYETHNSRNNITRQSLSFVKQTEAGNDTLHITLADSVLPLNEEKKGFMSRQKIAYTQDNKEKEEEIMKKLSSEGCIYIVLHNRVRKGEKMKKSKYTFKAGPIKMTTTLNGEYQGFERLKTPAGEFDCIKLTYTMKANMLLFFSETVNITEWYAQGIGLVKSEEYENKEKTKTIKTLIDIKEPL